MDAKDYNSRRKASVFFPSVNFSPFTNGPSGIATPPQRQTSFALRMGHLINFNLSGSSSSSKSSSHFNDNPSSANEVVTKRTKGQNEPSYHSTHGSQRAKPKTLDIHMLMNWRFAKLNVDEQIVIRIAAVAGTIDISSYETRPMKLNPSQHSRNNDIHPYQISYDNYILTLFVYD